MKCTLIFCFMGKEAEPGKTIPIAAVKERVSGMLMASVVPTKTTGRYISKRILAFLQEVGCEYGDLVVKSDQEEAIKSVVSEVGKLRAAGGGGKFIVENSPVGSSASNGIIERGIQSIEGQVRVLMDALEDRWKLRIPIDHPIICFLVEYAAFLLNRFEVGRDGMTSYERCKGKKANTLGIEFGEAVHWKRKLQGGALGKMSVTWADGVYLGARGKSGEIVVGDCHGIWKARSVQRKPFDERWSNKSVDMVRHVPWQSSNEDPDADGPLPAVIRLTPMCEDAARDVARERMPRSFYITQDDLTRHGYTAKCPGCLAILKGTARQGHSKACRHRLEVEMVGERKVLEAKRKVDEFANDAIQKDAKNRKLALERSTANRDVMSSSSNSNNGGSSGSNSSGINSASDGP